MMTSQLVTTQSGTIEYTLQGSGPAVLVCHGTSSDCFSACLTEPLLEAGFTVLTPSRPGYGRTSLEVGRSAAEGAQALVLLLDALQIESCASMGVSGGGPTAVALAAGYPQRVSRLILAAALTRPEGRRSEPSYENQMAFYGPMHSLTWGMLGLVSRVSPRSMARQTMTVFSTHDPNDILPLLSAGDVETIARFYQGHSSRQGALNDANHVVGADLLSQISQPTLVVHSREDSSVPFSHAEWSLKNIPHAELCEAGCTGHFFWVGPDAARITQRVVEFLRTSEPVQVRSA